MPSFSARIFQHFKEAAMMIQRRMEFFTLLPFETLHRLRLQTLVREIGEEPQG